MKYIKRFESKNDEMVDENIRLNIESILDDHLDEFSESFSYTIESKRYTGQYAYFFIIINSKHFRLAGFQHVSGSVKEISIRGSCPLIHELFRIKDKLSTINDIITGANNSEVCNILNKNNLFIKIHKLTGYKITDCDLNYNFNTELVKLRLNYDWSEKELHDLEAATRIGVKQIKESNDESVDIQNIESILDDHLDAFPEAFDFSIGTSSVFNPAKSNRDQKEILMAQSLLKNRGYKTISYPNLYVVINCPWGSVYRKSGGSPLVDKFVEIISKLIRPSVPDIFIPDGSQKQISDMINDVDLFQHIHKLTGYKISNTYYNNGLIPRFELTLSKEYETS